MRTINQLLNSPALRSVRLVANLLTALACSVAYLGAPPALAQDNVSQPQYGMIFEEDVPIRVRDGTVLRADVYRPDTADTARFPVLMSLSAYQKAMDRILPHESPFTHVERPEPEWWTARGYVLVFVDTRGTGTSPGQSDIWSTARCKVRFSCGWGIEFHSLFARVQQWDISS